MTNHTRDVGECASVVSLSGELDVYSSPALKRDLGVLVARGRGSIIIDLEKVSYIDSAAIGVFTELLRAMRAFGGTVSVVTRAARVRRLFQLLGLTSVLTIYDDELSALASAMSTVRTSRQSLTRETYA